MSRPTTLARGIAVMALVTMALIAGIESATAQPTTAPAAAPVAAHVTSEVPYVARTAVAERRIPRCWTQHHRCYSAITVNIETGHSFHQINAMTRKNAARKAWRKCRTHAYPGYCVKAGWVRNGYLALYYRTYKGVAREWASGARYSLKKAKYVAAAQLGGPGVKQLWTWVGTDHLRRYATSYRYTYGRFAWN